MIKQSIKDYCDLTKSLVELQEIEFKVAKWLHDNYEAISKVENWNTQENCRVRFEDLPKENKRVMLELSRRILNS